jgi:hypothetical protein
VGSRVRLCALAVAATALPNTLVCSLVSDDDGDHGGAHMTMRRLPFSSQQQKQQQHQPGMNEFGEKVITLATLSRLLFVSAVLSDYLLLSLFSKLLCCRRRKEIPCPP